MPFCFEATGTRSIPESAPTSWIICAAVYLPGVSNSRAVKVEPTTSGGPAVTLLAANEVAWRRKLDDEGAATHTKLIRGRPVKFDACDELVLCPPGTVEPPEAADVAYFLVENEDALLPLQQVESPVGSCLALPAPPITVAPSQQLIGAAPPKAPLVVTSPHTSNGSTAHTPPPASLTQHNRTLTPGGAHPAPSHSRPQANPTDSSSGAQGQQYKDPVLTGKPAPHGAAGEGEMGGCTLQDKPTLNHDQDQGQPQQPQQPPKRQQLMDSYVAAAPGAGGGQDQQPQQAPVPSVGPAQAKVSQECREVIGGVRDLLFPPQKGAPANASERPPSRLAGPELSAVWAGELEELWRRCDMPRTLIGVLGNTGAGKSSLLNVLLQEEDILPTNGMRASTSCPIELSYRPDGAYHATIEFMSKAEWREYVAKLLADMADDDGCIRPCNTDEARMTSEAPASQALLEAVYGKKAVRQMPYDPNHALAWFQSISNEVTRCMDQGTLEVRERDKKAFRARVGKYVDSTNKTSAMQAWPVVKVCKIAHNWKILSGGAVLVDLPGVRDANEARGAVAEAYMRRLHSVWVVADITRAVDDKTAKDLLGSSFKQRMMMDGHMDAITFVCTKSDNVHTSEVLKNLGVEEVARRTGRGEEEVCGLEHRILDLREAEEEAEDDKRAASKKVTSTATKCIRLYNEARFVQRRLRECEGRAGGGLGGPVAEAAAQLNLPKKLRKAWLKAVGGRRDSLEGDDDDEEEDDDEESTEGEELEMSEDGIEGDLQCDGADDCGEEEEEEEEEEYDDPGSGGGDQQEVEEEDGDSDWGPRDDDEYDRRPKTNKRKRTAPSGGKPAMYKQAKIAKMDGEQLRDALLDAATRFQQSRMEHLSAGAMHKVVAKRLAKCRAALRGPQLELNSLCARARNDFSKERLTQQFAEGIQEMEEAAAQPHRAAPRRPAPELPVFCVSTREAHKLEGRCKSDGPATTFKRVEHTEVPALRKHVSETADRGRVRAQAKLAHALFQFVESVAASLLNQRHEHMRHELVEEAVLVGLRALWGLLMGHVQAQQAALQASFLDGPLMAGLKRGLQDAMDRSRGLVREWGVELKWGSYKAVVARQGVFSSSAAKDQNWNRDLALPVFRPVTTLWDNLFTNGLRRTLADVHARLLGSLDAFYAPLRQELVGRLGVEPSYLDGLYERVKRDEALQLGSRLEAVEALVGERKKVLGSEVLEPAVRAAMAPAYWGAVQERGAGCFQRMKAKVEAHVESHGPSMLMGATEELFDGLEQLVEEVVEQLSEAATALLQRTRARFAQLWDDPPSTFADRYEAAKKLHPLAEHAARVCAKADPDGMHGQGQGQPLEPFTLPPPEELMPQQRGQQPVGGYQQQPYQQPQQQREGQQTRQPTAVGAQQQQQQEQAGPRAEYSGHDRPVGTEKPEEQGPVERVLGSSEGPAGGGLAGSLLSSAGQAGGVPAGAEGGNREEADGGPRGRVSGDGGHGGKAAVGAHPEMTPEVQRRLEGGQEQREVGRVQQEQRNQDEDEEVVVVEGNPALVQDCAQQQLGNAGCGPGCAIMV